MEIQHGSRFECEPRCQVVFGTQMPRVRDFGEEIAELTRVCKSGGWLLDCPGDSERDMKPDTELISRGWEELQYTGSFAKMSMFIASRFGKDDLIEQPYSTLTHECRQIIHCCQKCGAERENRAAPSDIKHNESAVKSTRNHEKHR